MPWAMIPFFLMWGFGYFAVPATTAYAVEARWPWQAHWAVPVAILGSWAFWNAFTIVTMITTQHYYHPSVHH